MTGGHNKYRSMFNMTDKRFTWQTKVRAFETTTLNGNLSKHPIQNVKNIEPTWDNFLKKSKNSGFFKNSRLNDEYDNYLLY